MVGGTPNNINKRTRAFSDYCGTSIAGVAPTLLIVRANIQEATTAPQGDTIHHVRPTSMVRTNASISVEEDIVLGVITDMNESKAS
ncbi:hypothetical protein PM082_009634 [Marasmius tenuissimus]|nr:hypothetical protein PM082_009634 [Marasmius tenuissimus]